MGSDQECRGGAGAVLGLRAVCHKGTAERNGLPWAWAWCLAVSMAMSEFVSCSFSLLLWV